MEVFPPKRGQVFVGTVSEHLANARLSFVSLTCGASAADAHNFYKLLLALNLRSASPKVLVHLIQIDKFCKALWALVQMLIRFGVNKLLFLKGDCCVGGQLRPDGPADFQEFRKASHFGELCAVTNYPEVYSSRVNARSERVCAEVRQVFKLPI